jgi:RNA polymerase sigma-70 factor (ECF subfamily)
MWLGGHRAAFERLLRTYLAPLRRLSWAYAREPADREDLFQEIALALWTALPSFRGDASERTWLYRVAHNTAIGFVTRRRRRAKHEEPGEALDRPASGVSPEQSAIETQQRERLWAAVRGLAMPDRQVVVLHLEGLSAGEIEAVTGLTAGSIATRLTRIRQKLAAAIQKGHEP